MDMELTPMFSKAMFEGEGGSYYSWSSKEFAVLGEAMVGAGLLVLKPGGFALPHYADSSKLGYVLQGEDGVAGLILWDKKTNRKEEKVVGLGSGDVIGVPFGSVSWWYNHGNSDCVIAFLGETSKAYVPGEFTYFLLTGPLGILGGFSTEFTSKALHINQSEANTLAKSQTGVLIVKLDPEDRNKIPQPHQNINIVNKYVQNILHYSPDIHVDRAGEATSFTEKNFPILEEIGVSCSLVKLETDAMLSPLYTCVSSVQIFYVFKGTAKIEIVGMNGNLVLDNKVVAGQVVVVPRFFTIGVVAQDQGMECFSITTTSRPADVVNFGGKESVLNALAPTVLQSALNVPPAFVKFIKGKLANTDILVPPMN
ncbi:hypothetical protein Ddye_026383 [Dipteronia dyeriana]|uniref:Cupin type-1 domain-containing protein n=1 Tax=Dipteronia dyeriana TaxID=168575 RepID=A0AAD9TMW9_9ROSI|nr:hypothetical protein Ddye_026383 [Dipteronia dyeriana]